MPDREKVINKVTAIVADMQKKIDEWKDYSDSELRCGLTCDCDWWYKTLQTLKDALTLLKEYDEALKLMVYQYCTMKPLTTNDEIFHNKFMSAGEAAFRLLGLENGQSTDGVWKRWFPNG